MLSCARTTPPWFDEKPPPTSRYPFHYKTNIQDIIPQVPKDVLIHDLLPLFAGLAGDDQDSVRHLTVADLIAIAQCLNPQETQELLGSGIRNLWSDKSWRVRYSVADLWVSLAKAIGGERAGEELVAAFIRLVKDNEAEVRAAIAKQIPGSYLSTCLISRILQIGSDRGYIGRYPYSHQGTRR
jgi:serine/threonine-protein phosphatase 2A regulatory subunit A